MHDLHLWKGCQFTVPLGPLAAQKYKNPACRKVAAALSENLLRSLGLVMIAGHSFKSGKDWQKCVSAAHEHYFGEHEPDEEHFARKRDAMTDFATDLLVKLQKGESSQESIKQFTTACYNYEVFSKKNTQAYNWIHDLLTSSIIQTWTAYEVLASELWEGVVKKRPSLDTRASWSRDQRSHSRFTSRSGIANRYRWTFPMDNADILSVVDNPAIHALALVRNILVHSAGKIDGAFNGDRKGFKPWGSSKAVRIPQLRVIKWRKIGFKVPFSGPMVRHFVDPVLPLVFKLLQSVDEWLIRHP